MKSFIIFFLQRTISKILDFQKNYGERTNCFENEIIQTDRRFQIYAHIHTHNVKTRSIKWKGTNERRTLSVGSKNEAVLDN